MKFPTIISGTAKDSDLSVMVGGVEKKGYDAYVIVDGAAKLFYKRAIEWTTEITESHHISPPISYGNSDTKTAFIVLPNNDDNYGFCKVTYNFIGPLNLKAGQTINIYSFSNLSDYAYTRLLLDGDSVHLREFTGSGWGEEYYTYIMPADRAISSITATVFLRLSPDISTSDCYMAVTINSDYGSFLLNNSGTFNQ